MVKDNNTPDEPKPQEQGQTVQIAADAPITIRIYDNGVDDKAEPKLMAEFETSRNVTVLTPKLTERLEGKNLENLWVTGILKGKDPETGVTAELIIYDAEATKVLTLLKLRSISPDEAMVASRGFFGDMLDMVNVKAVLVTAIFDEGQSSYVMLNKTVEVEVEHMLQLVAVTLMQLDKFKAQMKEAGVKLPGTPDDDDIITPGQAGFILPGSSKPDRG